MQTIEDWSLSDIERMVGKPWAPPPEDKPAARALYFNFVSERVAEATGEPCAAQWLLAGAVPDRVDALQRDTYKLRMQHDGAELRALAKQEMSVRLFCHGGFNGSTQHFNLFGKMEC